MYDGGGLAGAIHSVAFSPNGKLLAWGDNQFAITLWDIAADRVKARLKGHAGTIRAVTFSPDGKTLASAGFDYKKGGTSIKLWEVLTTKEWRSFDFTYKQSGSFHCVAFDRTGQLFVSGDNSGVVKLWDLPAGNNMAILDDKDIAVYGLKFSPNGTTLAAVRSDGSLVLWSMPRVVVLKASIDGSCVAW